MSAKEIKELNDIVPSNDLGMPTGGDFGNDDSFGINVEIEDEEVAAAEEAALQNSSGSLKVVRFNNAVDKSSATGSTVRQRRSKFAGGGVPSVPVLSFRRPPSDVGSGDKDAGTFLSVGSYQDVDWIGRWIIVPSYIVVMGSLVGTGWGFYDL